MVYNIFSLLQEKFLLHNINNIVLQPYLHESRHLHALKRARGAGGRFLNTKKLQHSKLTSPNHNLTRMNLSAESKMHQTEKNYRDGANVSYASSNSDGYPLCVYM